MEITGQITLRKPSRLDKVLKMMDLHVVEYISQKVFKSRYACLIGNKAIIGSILDYSISISIYNNY